MTVYFIAEIAPNLITEYFCKYLLEVLQSKLSFKYYCIERQTRERN